MPDTAEAKARRLAEITETIERMAEETVRLSTERVDLMVSLHTEHGWNNVQIGMAAGLTRARVSTILKPALEQRAVAVTG